MQNGMRFAFAFVSLCVFLGGDCGSFLCRPFPHQFDRQEQQRVANGVHRRHDPRRERRVGNKRGIDVKGVRKSQTADEKRSEREITGKAEEGVIPLFVRDVHLPEQEQRDHERGRKAVMRQPRNGGQIKYGRPLPDKGGVHHRRDPAEQAEDPQKMVRMVVLFPEQYRQRKHEARHPAIAFGEDVHPVYRFVPKHLRQAVGEDGKKEGDRQPLQNEGLSFFRARKFFGAKQPDRRHGGGDPDIGEMFRSVKFCRHDTSFFSFVGVDSV